MKQINNNKFDGWQMQDACKKREEMKVLASDSNTLVDDSEMVHKLGTKGEKTDGCKRNEERQRSDHTHRVRIGDGVFISPGGTTKS